MSALPTRPGDVSEWASLPEIAHQYVTHGWALAAVRLGQDTGQPPEELRESAIAALAYEHALAERALAGRWVNAAAALEYGASVEDVARAMGLDVEEVRVGLPSWADGQVRAGCLTPAERDDVLRLVEGADRRQPSCPACGGLSDPLPGFCSGCEVQR